MARIRKGVAYRKLERPYTRKSKYRTKNFVRAFPHNVIVRYVMGAPQKTFKHQYVLIAKTDVQLRSNSLEAGRQVAIKYLETTVGKVGFTLQLRKFPHHVLRENALASGAGADRLSTGMKQSFGKVIGIAAQTHKGDIVYEVHSDNEAACKEALRLIKTKLPNSYSITPKADYETTKKAIIAKRVIPVKF